MNTISRAEVLSRRLAAQLLSVPGPATATEVVRHLCCVQSQEWAHGFWSLGMRSEATYAQVQAEFDRGDFVRTHILRPTWHFVAPEDLGWLLALTSPRVQQRNAATYRREGLDDVLLERAAMIMVEAVAQQPRTRVELGRILVQHGIEHDGTRLAHLVMWAELEARLISGPIRGAQHTYVPMSVRIAAGQGFQPDQPLAELARRFLRGRGPSSPAELARWSSLTVTDARTAFDMIDSETTSATLIDTESDQTVTWLSTDEPAALDQDRVWWLALYDELPLSHLGSGFVPLPGHPHGRDEDRFVGYVVAGADDLGRWRRVVRGRSVELSLELAPGVGRAREAAARAEGERLARFLAKTSVWS